MNKRLVQMNTVSLLGYVRMRWRLRPSRKARLPVGGWAGLSVLLVLAGVLSFGEAEAASFDCANAKGDVDKLVCDDPELNELDELVVSYYESASTTLTSARREALRASQRNWLQDQSKCSGPTTRQCLFKRYKARLLLLEVQYGQGNSTKPLIYRCDGPENEINVSFFKTDPPTVSLSLGEPQDEPFTAVLQPSEKGEKYVTADGLTFWANGDEGSLALVNGKKAACRLM
jgi:uncharacterized protein